jgi:hypothetical protein
MNQIPLFNVEPGPNGRAFTRVTLQDLFAATALAGLMSARGLQTTESIAEAAYAQARAMMALRERDPNR